MSYPETPGYSNLTTSKEAAQKVDDIRQKVRVLNYIKEVGGATTFEVAEALDLLINSASARCADLLNAGKIVDSGKISVNQFGSNCIIWVPAPVGTMPKVRHKTYKELLEENERLRTHYNLCSCAFKKVIPL